MDNKNNTLNRGKIFIIIAIILVGWFIFFTINRGFYGKVIGVLQPIIVGAVLAYLLNPLMKLFTTAFNKLFNRNPKNPNRFKGLIKGLSITLTMLSFFAVIAAFLWLIIPQITTNVTDFVNNLPAKMEGLAVWFESMLDKYDLNSKYGVISEWLGENSSITVDSVFKFFEDNLFSFSGALGTEIISFFGTTFSLAFNWIIGLIVCVYILSSKELLAAQFKKVLFAYFSKPKVDGFLETAREGNKIVTRFIIGKLIDSTIIGIMCFITMLIFNIPYALLVSVIVGVTDIIPFFGPYFGAIPCTLLILLSNDPIKAIYFVIMIIVIQQVEGNIISPKIIGDTIGLSPFWVLAAMLVGGGLFGLPGMLLGVPVIAIIFFIVRKSADKRLTLKNMPTAVDDYIE